MRENYIQTGTKGSDNRTHLQHDWYSNGIPANVIIAANVYLDTSYGFAAFNSKQPVGMFIDEASGCYDRASFVVSETGTIKLGKFCMLNGTSMICSNHISIGNHCMLAWGSVITDTWVTIDDSLAARQNIMRKTAASTQRNHPFGGSSKPVVLEDNCWVGFGAVIMPGVRLGRGCIIGCKTVVTENVPPYAVVGGSPAKILKFITPNDQEGEIEMDYARFLKTGFTL